MRATMFLTANPSTGQVTGSGYTTDGTLPPNSYACTVEQAAAWQGSTIAAGAIVAPATPASTVPGMISNFQARAALFQTPNPAVSGQTMLDVVNAAVAATGGMAEIAWTSGYPLYRNGTMVANIATAIGATSAHMDAFFIAAAQIKF